MVTTLSLTGRKVRTVLIEGTLRAGLYPRFLGDRPSRSTGARGGRQSRRAKEDAMTRTEKQIDKLKAAHDRLLEAVESIVTGEDWQGMP